MKRIMQAVKALMVVVLAVSLALAARAKRQRLAAIDSYEQARVVAAPKTDGGSGPAGPAEPAPGADGPASDPEEDAASDPAARLAEIDLAALQEVNPDVVGWIEIPDTELSYPILQGRDNQYYLNRTWDRQRSPAGSIFLECTNDPAMDGFHTIIYGHRMNDGTMFGTLQSYTDIDFWYDHPSVYVALADGVYRYDIFSAQEAGVSGVVYRLDLEESHLEEEFFDYCRDHAIVNTSLDPTAEDRILTLSTCTGNGHATRWVVHGVLAEGP